MTQLNEVTKTIIRSDGTAKIYGHTMTGELLTVVMTKNVSDGNWSITEIAQAGRVTHVFKSR